MHVEREESQIPTIIGSPKDSINSGHPRLPCMKGERTWMITWNCRLDTWSCMATQTRSCAEPSKNLVWSGEALIQEAKAKLLSPVRIA